MSGQVPDNGRIHDLKGGVVDVQHIAVGVQYGNSIRDAVEHRVHCLRLLRQTRGRLSQLLEGGQQFGFGFLFLTDVPIHDQATDAATLLIV